MTQTSQPRRTGWTEARLAELVELWNARLSAAQIAARLGDGLTRSAVVAKLFRLGLSRDPAERRAARADGARQSRRKRRGAIDPRKLRPPAFPAAPLPVGGDPPGLRPLLVGIMELRPTSCRWPYPIEGETRFCGHGADGPYCHAHRRRAYDGALPPLTPEQIDALCKAGRGR
jgi:GcrA cell cycle regulator